jgi:hypothetical protein
MISALRGRCPRPLDECGAGSGAQGLVSSGPLGRPCAAWRPAGFANKLRGAREGPLESALVWADPYREMLVPSASVRLVNATFRMLTAVAVHWLLGQPQALAGVRLIEKVTWNV